MFPSNLVGLVTVCGVIAVQGAPHVELRALWLATVDNIDWPSSPGLSVESQQTELEVYLNLMEETNMNCLLFQVRPVGDAMYKSSLEPWSEYLTGKQGLASSPAWDPLQFVVNEAHHRGIQVHAWINPYRVRYYGNSTDGLAPTNMAKRFPEFAYPYGDMLWMDPAAEVVRRHILTVVDDILSRYKVDGLHIDDYYYPYPYQGLPFPDAKTYQEYLDGGGSLCLADWRRSNINMLVSMLSALVRGHKRTFSVAPGGFYRPGQPGGQPPPLTGFDPYAEIYADSKYWLEKGWMDWFIPNLFWQINPPQHSYPLILDWWLNVTQSTSKTHIFAGNALYKIKPPNDWNPTEIKSQVNISRNATRRAKGSLGNVHFSARVLRDNIKNVVDMYKEMYPSNAIIPTAKTPEIKL